MKIYLVLICVILVSMLCGCINSNGYDTENAEVYIDILEFQGFKGVDRGEIKVGFGYNNPDEKSTKCTLNELNYVLEGNDHYIGGGKIANVGYEPSRKEFFAGLYEYFLDDFIIYEDPEVNYNDPMVPVVYIHPELQNAFENDTPIKWTVAGELSFYLSDSGKLVKIPFELTHYS